METEKVESEKKKASPRVRFVRIYTPFIISVATLLNTILVLFIKSDELLEICYSMANIFGNSFIVDLYFLVCSRKMCIWYKLNILCLSGTLVVGIAYNVLLIDESLYLLAVIILSMLGITFFIESIIKQYFKNFRNYE